MLEQERLRKSVDLAFDQANALAAPAYAEQPKGAASRCRRDDSGALVIGRDHGRAAGLDQLREQAQLGGKVILQCRMIIEMIAAEIRKAAGRDTHAVETALIEPMRRRFDRKVRHAFAGELIEAAVQCNRVWRCERAVDLMLGRDEPYRADAGRRMAERDPDLTGERRNRRLSARASNRRDHLRLTREQCRRSQRQSPARVLDLDESNV